MYELDIVSDDVCVYLNSSDIALNITFQVLSK
jgi:hypothetical protein